VASHAGDPCEKEGEQGKTDEDKGSYSRTTRPAEITRLADVMFFPRHIMPSRRKSAKVDTVARTSFTLHVVSGLIGFGPELRRQALGHI